MRSLLGVLMVLAVSADDEVNIPGFAGESVLLPCNCTGINVSLGFKWQIESDGNDKMVIDQSDAYGRYKGRAKISVNDRENCSLSLSIITAKDTGKYKCIFHIERKYNPLNVNLNVSDVRNLKVSGSSDRSSQGPPKGRIRFLKIIPIVFLLGFCLVLWFRRERVSH